MSQVQGSLVRAYLYKALWTLTVTTTSGDDFYLRIGSETSTAIKDTDDGSAVAAILQAMTQFTATDITSDGSAGDITIYFIGDYAFSGITVEVVDADATVTATVARTFQTTLVTKSEGNGYYKLGAETSMDKNMEIENQDVTNKDSDSWRETKSQIRQVGLSTQNFFLSTENYDKLVGQWKLSLPVVICDTEPNVTGTEQIQNFGVYNINNITQGATFNQNVEFTADFQLTGSPTRVTTGV